MVGTQIYRVGTDRQSNVPANLGKSTSRHHCFQILLPLIFVLSRGEFLLAQAQHKPALTGLVVDVVSLKSGKNLRGVITSQQPNGSLTMVVRRDWLHASNAPLATSTLKANVDGRRDGWIQTQDRILELLKSPIESAHLTFFFQQELERLELLIADRNPADPEFLWIDVRHETITKIHRATPDCQRLLVFAWNEGLKQVETRDAGTLYKELVDQGVKLDAETPDLSDRLSTRLQDKDEWTARLALLEYSMVESLDFQGMGETLVRTQVGQPGNLVDVLPKLLQRQISSMLKDLTNDGPQATQDNAKSDWLAESIRVAEKEKVSGFRVTRLELDTTTSRVTVETRFVVKRAAGQWKTVWLEKETENGSKARPQDEARIEKDPQLKSALDTVTLLGIADAQSLRKAIRIGAATMAAQQSADGAFAVFKDRYVRHLDGPPLPTPSVP